METLGRTSYFWRLFPAAAEGVPFVCSFAAASKPVGDVALLDIDERADEASSRSVVMEEAMESRALSGRRCMLPPDIAADLDIGSALKAVS